MSLLERVRNEPSPVEWHPGYEQGHSWTSTGLVDVVNFVICLPESGWRKCVEEKLEELLLLKPGWDGYNSGPISRATAAYALSILDSSMRPDSPAPSVVPGRNGAVQLEWHEGGLDIELMIFRALDAELSVFYHDGRPPIEEVTLSTNFVLLSEAVKELS